MRAPLRRGRASPPTCAPFIDDMARGLSRRRRWWSRAPARSTLAELTALGVPAILIPFPFAADDHQTVNARELAERGRGACCCRRRRRRRRELARRDRASCSATTTRARAAWRAAARALGRPAARTPRSPTRWKRSSTRASRRAVGEPRCSASATRRIHFVGIGGIGMSGIAEVLLNLGYRVSGSDLKRIDTTRRLATLGARIDVGHARRATSAAPTSSSSRARSSADNPEVVEARARGDPGDPARRDARRADAHEVRRRGRRHARQDHHHLAGRHRAARGRARSRPR